MAGRARRQESPGGSAQSRLKIAETEAGVRKASVEGKYRVDAHGATA
jgi:hypothetical protein